MIELAKGNGVYFIKNQLLLEESDQLNVEYINNLLHEKGLPDLENDTLAGAKTGTIAHGILQAHNTSSDNSKLKIKYDAMASHDITFVGIIQTARISGLKEFPLPYVLTNCHNSLCAVGGTINEDDHRFGHSAALKYGGIFVPAHQAVIHQYMREMMAGCGKMILGSDSHSRYGALGTMAMGEGGPELVKQLLGHTYNIDYPDIIAVYLEGKPAPGVGPQDVAIALIGAVFKNGYVKNSVMEFIGPGIAGLAMDYRNGIDVMTTETTCLSSIWCTDEKVLDFFITHGREEAYSTLQPAEIAYYDGLVKIDLSRIEPMIALPFHPSNAFTIEAVNRTPGQFLDMIEEDARKLLAQSKVQLNFKNQTETGRLKFHQGIVAGCAGGTFENIWEIARIMDNSTIGCEDLSLSIYPSSQPVSLELVRQGITAKLMRTGAIMRSAFCGPCFGAGDTPANGTLSARHTTRNFPNREGSQPGVGQLAAVALMDARSIAATAIHNGRLTAATELDLKETHPEYYFDDTIYKRRIYSGFGKAQQDIALQMGPNIKDWPDMISLPQNLLLELTAVIHDPVTTTDELIPSGETSSYRSNPLKLAEFTLSRKIPEYVARAKNIMAVEQKRLQYIKDADFDIARFQPVVQALFALKTDSNSDLRFIMEQLKTTGIGSLIFARKPGDGSAREQAASCQKVLGGWGNIALDYATKRYRSNVINWGMLPLIINQEDIGLLQTGRFIYLAGIRDAIEKGDAEINASVIKEKKLHHIKLYLPGLATEEREIILAGCLMNYYKQQAPE